VAVSQTGEGYMSEIYVPNSNDINEWFSEKFSILAEIVQDYDPYLELRWIPSDKRTRDDKKPYVIVDTRSNYPVLYASELDQPEQILAKIIEGDNKNGDILRKLEAQEAANKLFRYKEWLDNLEEAAAETEFLMKSPLNWINFNGKKLDDQRRVIGPAKEVKHI
jgi:hypothetical protein